MDLQEWRLSHAITQDAPSVQSVQTVQTDPAKSGSNSDTTVIIVLVLICVVMAGLTPLFWAWLGKAEPSQPIEITALSKILSICKWTFILIIFVAIISSFSGVGSGDSSQPNQGYMSRTQADQMWIIEQKKESGLIVTEGEQDFLDSAKAGKFGKPYDDRPEKEHDGAGL